MIVSNDVVRQLLTEAARRSLDIVTLDFDVSRNPMFNGDAAVRCHMMQVAYLPYTAYAAGWEAGGVLRLGFLTPRVDHENLHLLGYLARYAEGTHMVCFEGLVADDFSYDFVVRNPDPQVMPIDETVLRGRPAPKLSHRKSRPRPPSASLRLWPAPIRTGDT